MNIILLSGGSGKRLWPLSNGIRSKQFLKIFRTEAGDYESMVQRVYRQIKNIDPYAKITIATSRGQVSYIFNQLGKDVEISVEPCRRDTFPAIALASTYLVDVQGVNMEESVAICPVDPYVDNDYFRELKCLAELAGSGEANLVLMGIEPTCPSESYGYIVPEKNERVSKVLSFKEKPNAKTAEKYISQGALWNGGVFACKLKYILDRAHEMVEFKDYQDLLDKYHTFPNISFDYAVVEKEDRIQVMRFLGGWKDLGRWDTLTESIKEYSIGKAIDNACSNVHIINELEIPVLAMGLKDVIICASADGILVSDKEQSSYIKPFVDKINNPIMFAEKSWGNFRVLDVGLGNQTIKVTLKPGCRMSYHSHKERDEVWIVVFGEGNIVVDGIEKKIKKGGIVEMKAGRRHTVIAHSQLELIEIQMGKEINVHDKKKYSLE